MHRCWGSWRGHTRIWPNCRRTSDAIYYGINAAATAALMGRGESARRIAGEVRALAVAVRRTDCWTLATLGEASLVLGRWEEAEAYYRRAAETAGDDYGSLASTRRNARLLSERLRGDRGRYDACFNLPNVGVFVTSPLAWPRTISDASMWAPFPWPRVTARFRRTTCGEVPWGRVDWA